MKREFKRDIEKLPLFIRAVKWFLNFVAIVTVVGVLGSVGSWLCWLWLVAGTLIASAALWYANCRVNKYDEGAID